MSILKKPAWWRIGHRINLDGGCRVGRSTFLVFFVPNTGVCASGLKDSIRDASFLEDDGGSDTRDALWEEMDRIW